MWAFTVVEGSRLARPRQRQISNLNCARRLLAKNVIALETKEPAE
jgi:hypothetical protein